MFALTIIAQEGIGNFHEQLEEDWSICKKTAEKGRKPQKGDFARGGLAGIARFNES